MDPGQPPLRVEVDSVSSVQRKLDVEIPVERVRAEIERAYQGLQQQVRLKGFRPGRVPRPILERYFGDRVRDEVRARLIEESMGEVLSERQIEVVAQPEITADQLNPDAPLRYSAMVEVRPEIPPPDYEGLEAERPVFEVPPEMVEERLQALRERMAEYRTITERDTVASGDVIRADLRVEVEGKTVPALSRRDALLEVGTGGFFAPLEGILPGRRRGEKVGVESELPDDLVVREVAGKRACMEATIKDILHKDLPTLDDEFARDHGQCEGLEELRQRIRGELEREIARRADARVRDQLMDALCARHPVEVPPGMIAARVRALSEELKLVGAQVSDEEALRREVERRAEQEVRGELLLEAISRAEGGVVGDEEVAQRISELAAAVPGQAAKLREMYRRAENRAALRRGMLRERALARIVASARITPAPTGG